MSREEQRASSGRIMAKMGPLTGVELETYNVLMKRPQDYVPPSERRICGRCGAEFRDTLDGKGNIVTPMLEKFSDHQAEHNHLPLNWSEANKRIEAWKEAARGT